jgi:CubicO group peptidase (beta-lactamase class C family)
MNKNKIEAYLKTSLDYANIPSIAAGVRHGDEYETFTLGYANYEEKIPLKEDAVFHFASIAKLFVGTAIMRLKEAGSLSLDDKLTSHIEGFTLADERYKEITLRHMLSHTSGMPDVEDYRWQQPEYDDEALARYALSDEIKNLRLGWHPSENRFRYSNIAYDILGTVIANASGKPFEAYINDNIFTPLKMKNTTFLPRLHYNEENNNEKAWQKIARPHYHDKQKHVKVQPYYPYNRIHAPSSTLTSTINDIKKFANHVIARSEATKQSSADSFSPAANIPGSADQKIGLSWFIRQQDGQTLYGHEGSDEGFRSSLWICPKEKIHITVLSNISNAPVKKINKQIFEILLA